MARKTSRRRSSARRSSRRIRRNGVVTDTIIQQMGGQRRLSAMIGAYNFSTFGLDGDSVTFKWKARAKNGANVVKITLDPSDTYHVEFWSARGARIKKVGDFDMIYEDQLIRLFETETGLYLSL